MIDQIFFRVPPGVSFLGVGDPRSPTILPDPSIASISPGTQSWAPRLCLARPQASWLRIWSPRQRPHCSPEHPLPQSLHGHRHKLYPVPGAPCQLGQSSVPLVANGRGRDPLGSWRAMQIIGNPAQVVYGAAASFTCEQNPPSWHPLPLPGRSLMTVPALAHKQGSACGASNRFQM